jgi:hypothetical protein
MYRKPAGPHSGRKSRDFALWHCCTTAGQLPALVSVVIAIAGPRGENPDIPNSEFPELGTTFDIKRENDEKSSSGYHRSYPVGWRFVR